jgi:hypothetical protein
MKQLMLSILLVMAWCGDFSSADFPDQASSGFVPEVLELPIAEQTTEISESKTLTRESATRACPFPSFSAGRRTALSRWRLCQTCDLSLANLPLASTRLLI